MLKKNKPSNNWLIHFAITLVVGIGLLAWGFIDPVNEEIAGKYLWVWLMGMLLFIFAYIKLPVADPPITTQRIEYTVAASLCVSALVIALAGITSTLSFIQLYSFIPSTGLNDWVALFIFGFVIVIAEENLMAPLSPTLIMWFRENKATVIVSLLMVAVLFGLMHMVIEGIILSLLFSAFFFRVIAGIGNNYFGRLFGDVSHSFFNSFMVAVIGFGWPLFSLWFFPVFLVVLPYFLRKN